VIKRILFYFNITGYKFVTELPFGSDIISNDRQRNIASAIVITFFFTIYETIFNWDFHLSWNASKIFLIITIVYFTIIDTVFYKDIENISANYYVSYNKFWYTFFKIFLAVGLICTIVFFYRMI
jgi:hypothetical protein